MSNLMTLEQCTKAELVGIIRRFISEYHIGRALIEVAKNREIEKLDKADALLEKASEELQAYLEIAGKANEDPESVTSAERRRAFEHYKNYIDLSEQWEKAVKSGAKMAEG